MTEKLYTKTSNTSSQQEPLEIELHSHLTELEVSYVVSIYGKDTLPFS